MAGVLDILAQLHEQGIHHHADMNLAVWMGVEMKEFQYHLKRNMEGNMLVDGYMRFHEKYKYLVTMRNLLFEYLVRIKYS